MTTAAPAGGESVLILGGGLIGLAVAHGLARRGETVKVLSRRRSEAAGFVAAGMLAPHAEGLGGALLELGQASLALIPAWVEAIEADSDLGCGLRPCGIVVPFTTAGERDAFATAAWGRPLDRSQLEREVAGIDPRWRAGLLFAQDGQIDNRRRLMRALERACVNRGVRFEEGTEVMELQARGGRLEAVRLVGADGEERELACERAVLCCGAWSARLLPQLPVFPVKGQMLSLQAPMGALERVVFGPGTYLVPREDGLVVVGATSEPEAGFGEGLTPAGQRQLEAGLAALLPAAALWPPMERWWGFRPCTPDEAPLLGPGPLEGLWLATGHHRNGVLLAAISAELMAAAITPGNGEPEGPGSADPRAAELLDLFHWRRFAADGARADAANGVGSVAPA
ncbi:MAG: glycine oxidase ThiO [Cyanobium sp.]